MKVYQTISHPSALAILRYVEVYLSAKYFLSEPEVNIDDVQHMAEMFPPLDHMQRIPIEFSSSTRKYKDDLGRVYVHRSRANPNKISIVVRKNGGSLSMCWNFTLPSFPTQYAWECGALFHTMCLHDVIMVESYTDGTVTRCSVEDAAQVVAKLREVRAWIQKALRASGENS